MHHDHQNQDNNGTFKLGLLPTEAATQMRASADDLEAYLSTTMNHRVAVRIQTRTKHFRSTTLWTYRCCFFDGGPAAMAHSQLVLNRPRRSEKMVKPTTMPRSLFVPMMTRCKHSLTSLEKDCFYQLDRKQWLSLPDRKPDQRGSHHGRR